jgi:hypothetical protein
MYGVVALYEELASRSCGKCNGGYSMRMDEDTKKGILESMFIVHKCCPDDFEMELAGKDVNSRSLYNGCIATASSTVLHLEVSGS